MENSIDDGNVINTKENELNELKESIANKAEKKKCCRKIDFGSIAITFVLAVMIAVSAVQTYELTNILNKINSGSVDLSGGSNASAPVSPSVDNLPNMVGGC